MQLLHLDPGRHLGLFPVGLASRACLTIFRWALWIHGRTKVVVFFQSEAVRHSGLCEFHSCALCREVSHKERKEGDKMPWAPNHWGVLKSRNNVAGFFFNAVHLLPNYLRLKYGGAKPFSCPGRNLNSVRHFVAPGLFEKIPTLVLAPELIFLRSLPKIHEYR